MHPTFSCRAMAVQSPAAETPRDPHPPHGQKTSRSLSGTLLSRPVPWAPRASLMVPDALVVYVLGGGGAATTPARLLRFNCASLAREEGALAWCHRHSLGRKAKTSSKQLENTDTHKNNRIRVKSPISAAVLFCNRPAVIGTPSDTFTTHTESGQAFE